VSVTSCGAVDGHRAYEWTTKVRGDIVVTSVGGDKVTVVQERFVAAECRMGRYLIWTLALGGSSSATTRSKGRRSVGMWFRPDMDWRAQRANRWGGTWLTKGCWKGLRTSWQLDRCCATRIFGAGTNGAYLGDLELRSLAQTGVQHLVTPHQWQLAVTSKAGRDGDAVFRAIMRR